MKLQLKCTLTGHEIPFDVQKLQDYIKSPKFLRSWRIYKIMEKYGEYFDDIGDNKFGCKVTRRIITKDPDALERHINGKKFKRDLEKSKVLINY
ncbi:unnamed protein product [Dracunculus medinensis]|uniref:30S ribosomal protein S6 n=1 Tax=Dracunculus medinensis TaxID=318479 RepID=A0A0N4UHE4_DRAME|nr:unnamed protein product [Dracunculus medinensis]